MYANDNQLPLELEDQASMQAVLAKIAAMRNATVPTPVEKEILSLLIGIVDRLHQMDEKLLTDRLWTVKHVAKYLGCSEDVARRALKAPGAPKAIRIPSTPGHHLPAKYNPDQVQEYVQRLQKRKVS